MASIRPVWLLLVPIVGAFALSRVVQRTPATATVKIVGMPIPVVVASPPMPAPSPPAPPSVAPVHAVALRDLLPLPVPVRSAQAQDLYDDHLALMSRGHEIEPAGVAAAILAVHDLPGNVVIRAAVACGLARQEMPEAAQAVIEQLRAVKSCPSCVDAAISAAECVDGVARAESPIRNAARAVLGALSADDGDALATYVTAPVTVTTTCSVCDGDVSQTKRWTPAALIEQARMDNGESAKIFWHGPDPLFCDATCCFGPTGLLSHSATSITSICFVGPRDHPRLSTISALAG